MPRFSTTTITLLCAMTGWCVATDAAEPPSSTAAPREFIGEHGADCHGEEDTPLSPEVLQQIQARLDTFTMRNDGKHHTPRPGEQRTQQRREQIEAAIAGLDANQIQQSSVLRLQALILSEEDLRVLSQFKKIRLLSLSKCTITAEGFAHLAEAWSSSLEQLRLSYVDLDGGGSIADSVAELKRLESLTFNKCSGIGIDTLRAMSEHPIFEIDMNRPSGGIDPEALFELLGSEYKSLRKLDLHHWQKHDELRAAFRARRPEVAKGKVRDRTFDIYNSETVGNGSRD